MKKFLSILFAALAIAPLSAQTPTPVATPVATPAATPTPVAATLPKPTPIPTPEPTTREIIDKLSDAQLDQAIQDLRATFLDASRTDDRQLRLATLEGLIARLTPGLVVTAEASIKPGKGSGFLAEILDDRIGYMRLGALSKEALAQMETSLTNFKEKKLHSVILDCAAHPPPRTTNSPPSLRAAFVQRAPCFSPCRNPARNRNAS